MLIGTVWVAAASFVGCIVERQRSPLKAWSRLRYRRNALYAREDVCPLHT